MITIALDESGTPEKVVKKSNCDKKTSKEGSNNDIFFIAGIIYDDKNNEEDKQDTKYWQETQNEQKRLDAYFKKVAKTVGCTYPLDLHRSRNIYNKDNVDIMEEEIKNTLK